MHFSPRTLLLVAAVALVAAACSNASVVATVDGSTIDNDTIVALRTSFQDSTNYDGEFYRGDLTNMIFIEAQKNAAERDFGLTGLDDPKTIATKIANPTEEEAQIFATIATTEDRTEATAEAVAVQLIIRDAVQAELVKDPDFLKDAYENKLDLLTSVCASHIVTETQDEAAAAKARIVAGEDFSAVASEVSLDTGSLGGHLPCPMPLGQVVPEFAAAAATVPIGEMTDPVQSQFGWHIILVDERTGPTSFEALQADPMAYVPDAMISQLWVDWIDLAVREADIDVASRVGIWAPESHGILPPPSG
jgi:parvulin-like peptidyl-prolyl isomerase